MTRTPGDPLPRNAKLHRLGLVQRKVHVRTLVGSIDVLHGPDVVLADEPTVGQDRQDRGGHGQAAQLTAGEGARVRARDTVETEGSEGRARAPWWCRPRGRCCAR